MASGASSPPSSSRARAHTRSPRARAGRRRRRWAALPAAAISDVATRALSTNGPGRQARPISSMRRMTSRSVPSLPPSSPGSGGRSSPARPWRATARARGARRRQLVEALGRAVLAQEIPRGGGQELLALRGAKVHGRASAPLAGKAEPAGGHRGAEDFRGPAGDGVAEAGEVGVLDLAVERRPARRRAGAGRAARADRGRTRPPSGPARRPSPWPGPTRSASSPRSSIQPIAVEEQAQGLDLRGESGERRGARRDRARAARRRAWSCSRTPRAGRAVAGGPGPCRSAPRTDRCRAP